MSAHDRLAFANSDHAQAGPLSRAMRPATGMKHHEQVQARALVKQLLRAKLDHLPPSASLSEAEKDQVYAEAAHVLSGDFGREVTADRVKLVAATLRTPKVPPTRRATELTPRHHSLLKAEADAEESHITSIVRRALDAYFELTPEA